MQELHFRNVFNSLYNECECAIFAKCMSMLQILFSKHCNRNIRTEIGISTRTQPKTQTIFTTLQWLGNRFDVPWRVQNLSPKNSSAKRKWAPECEWRHGNSDFLNFTTTITAAVVNWADSFFVPLKIAELSSVVGSVPYENYSIPCLPNYKCCCCFTLCQRYQPLSRRLYGPWRYIFPSLMVVSSSSFKVILAKTPHAFAIRSKYTWLEWNEILLCFYSQIDFILCS